MNTMKMGFLQEKVSQNYHPWQQQHQQHDEQQHPWQVGITIQPSELAGRVRQQQQQQQGVNVIYGSHGSSCSSSSNTTSTIMDRIGSPASAFYATEIHLGFPQNEFNPYQQSRDNISNNTFGCVVNESFEIPHEKPYKVRCSNPLERERIMELKRKLLDDNYDNVYGGQIGHTMPSGRSPVSVHCTSPGAAGTTMLPSKTRIRWTQDLHDRFVECVNCLGGAEKATPKAILKLMDSEGLTIFHVKSHLQKYRIAKYMPESAEVIAGKSEKKGSMDAFSHIDSKTGMQIKDALQMQLAVQKQLHEQLEIQRDLQLRIEEQGKQLKKMFDQQQQKSNKYQNSLSSSSHDNQHSTSLDEVKILNLEDDTENTLFPSKIS